MRQTLRISTMIAIGLALSACTPPKAPPSSQAGEGSESAQAAGAALPLPDIGAPLADAAASPFQGEFEAAGEEPFWTMDVLQEWVSFARLNLPGVGGLPGKRRFGAKGMALDAGPLSLVISNGPCTATSGDVHEFNAVVRHDGVLYQGCARHLVGERVSAGWSGNLLELMPAITTCMGRVKEAPARVTIAYENADGEKDSEREISVRLLQEDGGRYECITRKAGSEIRYFEVIGDQDVLNGERDPLFTPAPNVPPKGPCLSTEPAPNGLGSFTRRTC